jgi:hypothetical protein
MGGLALTPAPSPAPLDPPQACPRESVGRGLWERGDSGERLRHPMAVDCQCEQLFAPPRIPAYAGICGRGGTRSSRMRHIPFGAWSMERARQKRANVPTCQRANVLTF